MQIPSTFFISFYIQEGGKEREREGRRERDADSWERVSSKKCSEWGEKFLGLQTLIRSTLFVSSFFNLGKKFFLKSVLV